MRQKPKSIGIISKCNTPEIIKTTGDIIGFLKNKVDIVGHPATARRFKLRSQSIEEMQTDMIVCIGGDGTILKTLQSMEKEIPILGINMGAMGFLAGATPERALPAVQRTLKGFKIEERIRLAVHLNGEDLPYATNEAVILTSRPAKLMHFKIKVDGDELATLRADGVVFATPTGSTAYAMSAGGPIVDPRVDAIIIVPLAPFTLLAKPIVVSAASTITVDRLNEKESTLVIDGHFARKLKRKDEMVVEKADRPAQFVKTEDTFFSKVRSKLMEK